MKKFILASVALLAVFASCKKEDIRTVYETTPAEATITVEVFDAFLGQPENNAKLSADQGSTVSGYTVTLKGNKSIKEKTVTIHAQVVDTERDMVRSGKAEVKVYDLAEGGKAAYSCKIVIGSPKEVLDYEYECVDEKVETKTGELEKATHSHDGKNWVVNNTEFILFGETSYVEKTGTFTPVFAPSTTLALTDFETAYMLDAFTNELIVNSNTEDKTFEYQASAFSYFNVVVTYKITTKKYEFRRVFTLENGEEYKEVIGTAEIDNWATAGVEKVEIAAPDHASHYVHGEGIDDPAHSHGHGAGSNAGGGIIIGD